MLTGMAAGLLVAGAALLAAAAPAAAAPPNGGGGVHPFGIYPLRAVNTADPQTTREWKVTWQIPGLSNGDQAWMAVGEWYFGFETGVYYTNTEGWWVYFYGDSDGRTGDNPACFQSWDVTGGHCTGAMENLRPGQQITFTYQWCDANFQPSVTGQYNCAWVDVHDGQGDRFLAGEYRPGQTVEMYTHDVETFGDSGVTEPIIPCGQPVTMLGQQVRSSSGTWSTLTGNSWNFVTNASYQYQNVNTAANPATWQACSRTASCPTAWNASTLYSTGTQVGYNGHIWQAKWWTYGDTPGVSNAWSDLGPC